MSLCIFNLHTQYLWCDCTNAWSNQCICRGIYRHGDQTFLFADTKKPDKIFLRCRCGEKALFCPPVALLLSDGQKDGTWHYRVKRGPAKSDINLIRPGSRPGYNGTGIVFFVKETAAKTYLIGLYVTADNTTLWCQTFCRFTGWIK